MVLPGLGDNKFHAPKEVFNEMVGDGSDSEFVHKISKTFMKRGEEKGVISVYPLDWINPKGEKLKGFFTGILFIQTMETIEGIWLCFKDPLKQEQTLLYQ